MQLVTVVLVAFVLGYVGAQSTTPASPERQRYAILMAYMLKGSRNVRYETMPMQMVDQNGLFLIYANFPGNVSIKCCHFLIIPTRKGKRKFKEMHLIIIVLKASQWVTKAAMARRLSLVLATFRVKNANMVRNTKGRTVVSSTDVTMVQRRLLVSGMQLRVQKPTKPVVVGILQVSRLFPPIFVFMLIVNFSMCWLGANKQGSHRSGPEFRCERFLAQMSKF